MSDFCANQQHPRARPSVHRRPPEILDLDGDGISDFALVDNSDHWTFVYNDLTTLTNGQRGIKTRSSLPFSSFAPSGPKPRPYFVDLNGDGLPDLVHRHDDGTGASYLRVWKNTRQGFTFISDEAVVLRNRGTWPGSWINPPEDIPVLPLAQWVATDRPLS